MHPWIHLNDLEATAHLSTSDLNTLRTLLKERSILSEQGSIFLENQLSEQAELSEPGGIIL